MTSKPLNREELTNKLFPYHGLIPTDAMNQIEANRDAYWKEQLSELRERILEQGQNQACGTAIRTLNKLLSGGEGQTQRLEGVTSGVTSLQTKPASDRQTRKGDDKRT